MKIVLVTGGFDPLHSGHIEYFRAARELGDKLVVGVNSDNWLSRKKGSAFMPWEERATIVSALHYVDRVINFDDGDGSAKDAIRKTRTIFPGHDIVFANGGDRTKDNIPEMDLLKEYLNIRFVFGVGGNYKKNSSSWILNNWAGERVKRLWGEWRVLSQINNTVKVKELVVQPGQKLSMQRHKNRNELWFIAQGKARISNDQGSVDASEYETIKIPANEWHQLENIGSNMLHVVEIQHGSNCQESDIERK
jgi:D-beta-D-heptose 7-phosphate kinase/D-beta-D-heptose 1-phosphate adenosyltransferase